MDLDTIGIRCQPVRTPTLPPATHTNVWIQGNNSLTVFDPASPWEDEQARLFDFLAPSGVAACPVAQIVLTHHHHDHVGGAKDLQERCVARWGVRPPIVAHPATADLLSGIVAVDQPLVDGDELCCEDVVFEALFTPGHAPGHLAFAHQESGVVIAGDMVAGIGTIAIDPGEGDLQLYLDSLQRLIDQQPNVLLPAHGPPLVDAELALRTLIAHRHDRTKQIRSLLRSDTGQTHQQLALLIYVDVPRAMLDVAAGQVLTHLEWMRPRGMAVLTPSGWIAT